MSSSTEPASYFYFETWRLYDPLYLIFCIPATIHYIIVLKVVSHLKENNSFLFIFTILGISDIFYFVVTLLCELFHYTNWVPDFAFVCCVVASYYGVFFNLLSNGLLSLNRFCATWVWYNTYFDKPLIKLYFLIISLVSFIATIPGGTLMIFYFFKDYSLSAQYGKTGLDSFNFHRTIIAVMMITDALISFFTSLFTLYRLRKYKINYDKSLLLVTTFHIFPDVLVAMFNIDMIFQVSGQSQFMNELSRMFLIFLVSFNSLTIVCTNRQIRKEYFTLILSAGNVTRCRTTVSRASTTLVAPSSDRITVF